MKQRFIKKNCLSLLWKFSVQLRGPMLCFLCLWLFLQVASCCTKQLRHFSVHLDSFKLLATLLAIRQLFNRKICHTQCQEQKFKFWHPNALFKFRVNATYQTQNPDFQFELPTICGHYFYITRLSNAGGRSVLEGPNLPLPPSDMNNVCLSDKAKCTLCAPMPCSVLTD